MVSQIVHNLKQFKNLVNMGIPAVFVLFNYAQKISLWNR